MFLKTDRKNAYNMYLIINIFLVYYINPSFNIDIYRTIYPNTQIYSIN